MTSELEYSFLCACQEVVKRQQELVPALAHTLQVQPEQVFYHWAVPPRCSQTGRLANGEWDYFFHGLECNLKNVQDGRFLRVEFGPKGRFDTFSGWSVLQFVMTAQVPWHEFPDLRAFLADGPPPYDELSGSYEKTSLLSDRLERLGFVEAADKNLQRLVEQHTHVEPDGSRVVSLPTEFNDITRYVFWDVQVCQRWILSDLGKHAIEGGIQAAKGNCK